MESLQFLQYLWDNNIISKDILIQKVLNNQISKENFFDITRLHFDSVKRQKEKGETQ